MRAKSVVSVAAIVGYNQRLTPHHTIKEALALSTGYSSPCAFPLLLRSSVVLHNATIQQPLGTVSPNWNPTIMMLQAEARFVIKHNVVPFRCPWPPFITSLAAQNSMVFSQM
ncbi:hypothetical protein TNCV_1996351 [Trichonephila clavipes]|uniref:Uncharacterized protein n=1 Tax=Trichonephila clavipes TaxID=2585209 RepID=A0A8X6V734_TRICX|nr:hypothetical protein TNCV_1996351 [Trichonephila clavipes]